MVNFAMTDPQKQQFRYDYDMGKLPAPLTATLPLSLTEKPKLSFGVLGRLAQTASSSCP